MHVLCLFLLKSFFKTHVSTDSCEPTYRKTSNKKHATCFVLSTLSFVYFVFVFVFVLFCFVLQLCFVLFCLTCLATNKVARFVFVGGKTRNIAIQLVFQQLKNGWVAPPIFRGKSPGDEVAAMLQKGLHFRAEKRNEHA